MSLSVSSLFWASTLHQTLSVDDFAKVDTAVQDSLGSGISKEAATTDKAATMDEATTTGEAATTAQTATTVQAGSISIQPGLNSKKKKKNVFVSHSQSGN